ncbi:MAG: glycosyltransferase family 2 protein, partial [Myxococcota bacterium]
SLPGDGALLLVDDGAWAADRLAGRSIWPFLERGGLHWGSPADDATAIAELERMRGAGATAIVFVWSTFWWLDHYRGFREHLSRYACLRASELVVAFDLAQRAGAHDA